MSFDFQGDGDLSLLFNIQTLDEVMLHSRSSSYYLLIEFGKIFVGNI